MKGKDYLRFWRRARRQLETTFDLPPNFSRRAREGLLGSLMLAAADEAKFGTPSQDQRIAWFHVLLIRER